MPTEGKENMNIPKSVMCEDWRRRRRRRRRASDQDEDNLEA